jgi:hypothetical protein
MNYLVDPQTLVFNAHSVNGFTKMVGDENIPQWDLLEVATDVAEEWTEDWEEGEGATDIPFTITSNSKEITHLQLDGNIPTQRLKEAVEAAEKACEKILDYQKRGTRSFVVSRRSRLFCTSASFRRSF